jgi:hypothetical protein
MNIIVNSLLEYLFILVGSINVVLGITTLILWFKEESE